MSQNNTLDTIIAMLQSQSEQTATLVATVTTVAEELVGQGQRLESVENTLAGLKVEAQKAKDTKELSRKWSKYRAYHGTKSLEAKGIDKAKWKELGCPEQ